MTKILLTGATGHAGSCLAEQIIRQTDWEIISLQRLSGGGPDRLAHLPANRIRKVYHDFRAPVSSQTLRQLDGARYIVHNGAAVPNVFTTLSNPSAFVQANIVGTFNMLEAARSLFPEIFLYTSSAQVLGPSPACLMPELVYGQHKEDARLVPPHPYAASKAAGEMLVGSYHSSFQVPTIVTRVMNLFGERQQPTKFIPSVIGRILNGISVPVHVDANNESCVGQWLHGAVYADALLYLLTHGKKGETYHIAGEEKSNIDVVGLIGKFLHHPALVKTVPVADINPAYLQRYLIADPKLRALGWHPAQSFEYMLAYTVLWTARSQEWL